jgi:hypothetical protein
MKLRHKARRTDVPHRLVVFWSRDRQFADNRNNASRPLLVIDFSSAHRFLLANAVIYSCNAGLNEFFCFFSVSSG